MTDKKKKILIVDDSKEIGELEKAAFEQAGFDTDIAEDGKSGMEMIRGGKYDLVVMDIIMPNKTGFEVLDELQLLGVTTPIMIYSNLWEGTSSEEVLRKGAVRYFQKESTPLEVIVAQVKKYLDSH